MYIYIHTHIYIRFILNNQNLEIIENIILLFKKKKMKK